MKFLLTLLFSALFLASRGYAVQLEVGTLVNLNQGHEIEGKQCSASEQEKIQGALTELAPSIEFRRRSLADCTLCYKYFPFNPAGYCFFLFPNGECDGFFNRNLRGNSWKESGDLTTHPKYEAKCKQQSKAIAKTLTSKKFLDGFSDDCIYLLEQKMEFVCLLLD